MTAHWRWGLRAVLAAACVAALAMVLPPAWPPLAHAAVIALATVLAIALIAVPLWRALARRHNESAAVHGQVAQLLGLAAHAHIELDPSGRVLRTSARAGMSLFGSSPPQPGHAIWDLPQVRLEPEDLTRLRQAVIAKSAWPELSLAWHDSQGGRRHLSLCGLPRRDATGRVVGHWALLRDRDAEVHARDAQRAVETRFHELFRRIPSPLVLHRQGHVLDANPAAVALFGFDDLHSMLGTSLLTSYAEGEDRERAQARLDLVDAMPLGQTLPAHEYKLAPRRGGALVVQVSSAPVEVEDGRAILSIYTDETERRQAEEAVMRSEALLSHLVSTSPDAITLTEMATGRYAMVNPSFVRITGFEAEEVIGRTSTDIGIWVNEEERRTLVRAIREQGSAQNLPATFRARDGRKVLMLMSAARFDMDGRAYLVIASRDVTANEQSRLERQAILDNALMGIALTRDQHFVLVNPRFESMFGWPPGLMVGQHGSVVWPSVAAHQAVGRDLGPALSRGEQIEVERPMMRRDGSVFMCRILAKALSPTEPGRGGTLWLLEDITDRRQVEQALARARDDAEAASRAKSAFLANTSHEIRTPLNALLGLARLARQPGVDESRRRQYIEQISDSAETLSGILSDILDLSKIEAGKMHLDSMPFDLRALLATLHQAYGSLADTKGLDMSLVIDEGLPAVVVGDPVRLRQILSNYLNNALKFTDSGSLRLSVHETCAHQVRFEVIDTGPGIDDEQQGLLFRPFSQADVSTTRRVGGTGLGLSICRQLAELMGGQVGVVSLPGQGSCFWAEVPLPPGEIDALDSGSSGFGIDPIAGTRVLLVEDNAVNMMIAVALLEQWGVEVSQAGDGLQAIEAVRMAHATGRPIDLVLMDVQMPGMSGHEAARILRRTYSPRDLPIVALTAAALVSERDQALAAGMNDFLTKPIDSGRLRNTLARTLRARDELV
ncbi:MAG: PAS domain S-box protein [Vitreoscilla sp.]|nr:PAS domain S-box protein [Vitreoscilla sp.]